MLTSSSGSMLRKYLPYSRRTSGMCSCVPTIRASQSEKLRGSQLNAMSRGSGHKQTTGKLAELQVHLADLDTMRGHHEQSRPLDLTGRPLLGWLRRARPSVPHLQT